MSTAGPITYDSVRKGSVLLDFYTNTCAPCKMLSPVLDEIEKSFPTLKVAKIDVTQNPDMSQRFGVMSVPTVVLMVDSKVKEVSRGFSNKETLVSMVRKHVAV